jgi:hypothetical protein
MANTSNLSPHSCPSCAKIVIDGTGPKVEQRYEFFHFEVWEFAQHCPFFERTLNVGDLRLYRTDRLVLSISEESEDLEYLNINWVDANGHAVSDDDTNQLELHFFSEKGTL